MQRDLLDIVIACPERRELADILRTRIVEFLLGGVQFRDRYAPRLKPPVGELIPLLRNLKHTSRVGKLATLCVESLHLTAHLLAKLHVGNLLLRLHHVEVSLRNLHTPLAHSPSRKAAATA